MTEEKINYVGISAFYYAAIPAILALAAICWLAFGQGLHIFNRALSQEARHVIVVGEKILPKAPMKIVLRSSRDSRVVIDRAEIDGGDVWVYYRNATDSRIEYIHYWWQLVAADGTVVKSADQYPNYGSENGAPNELDVGQRGEMHLKIQTDPRAVTLVLRMK